ncbi:hypothetical protein KMW28_09385 [Flammeovirga yaeyamensis]|uniref:Lipoprotein n=1 Tax=Flammeovirga yaeyamensis TaxID=367791 RepID=A0AAX1N884_9BACT|nr:hypothetical protein [Flammeovirga yaeyamensis]MBB3698828.1 hypothetical protein [Flammeovirga yaeyamensis]NMF37413.1 hypothetical protein [Flammeovirga yaeyamensis]QWG03774.1 hypothetical protein KMW28_09385 [Flammeovirga yaeyamensis]
MNIIKKILIISIITFSSCEKANKKYPISQKVLGDTLTMHYYQIEDSIQNRVLNGYWGYSKQSKTIYFQKVNDPDNLYSIFSFNDHNLNKKVTYCGPLYSKTYCYESEAKRIDDSDVYLVTFLVEPIEGVNTTWKKHLKFATYGKFIYSLDKGPIWFNYNPKIDYTILPWSDEWVRKNEM